MKKLETFYPLDPNNEHYSEDWKEMVQETWIGPLTEIYNLKYLGHISTLPSPDSFEGLHILQFLVPDYGIEESALNLFKIEEEGFTTEIIYTGETLNIIIIYSE